MLERGANFELDCFRLPRKNGHKPSGKHQRACPHDEGLIPRDTFVGHHRLNGGAPATIGSGDMDIKASGDAFRWNRKVRALDDYMWECE